MSVSLFAVFQITLCPALCVLTTDLNSLTPAIDNRAAVLSYVTERVAKSCLFISRKHQCVLDAPQKSHTAALRRKQNKRASVFSCSLGEEFKL